MNLFSFLSHPFLFFNENFASISMKLFDFGVMIMPTSGYVDTCRLMIQSQSPGAFSYMTTLILISAHGLKILYFIYHPYALRIFGQSVTQFLIAFVMAFLKYHYSKAYISTESSQIQRRHSTTISPKKHAHQLYQNRLDLSYYLMITSTKSFAEFFLSFLLYATASISLFFIIYYMVNETLAISLVGVVANIIDSTVSIPTFVKIVIRRDINNVSFVLIMQFICGDYMKLALFIFSHTPWSFIAGAVFQATIDTILFFVYLKLSYCPSNKTLSESGQEMLQIPSQSSTERSQSDDDIYFEAETQIESGL